MHFTLVDKIANAPKVDHFFIGWPKKPSQWRFSALLDGADVVVYALEKTTNQVIGFGTALTDGCFSAYIPLIEVLPAYQSKGVGAAILRKLLEKLRYCYMIDVVCDKDLEPFYERQGMRPQHAMSLRKKDRLIDKNSLH